MEYQTGGPRPSSGIRVRRLALGVWNHRRIRSARTLCREYAILFAAFLIYLVSWSYITTQKYFALNSYVFDLGFSGQSLWFVTHNSWTFQNALSLFVTQGVLFILAPIYYIVPAGSLLIFLVVFQTAFLGAGVFPLYAIAKAQLHDRKLAHLLALSYLIFFPMAGVNWFDFHYMALFIILFLSGFYLYLRNKLAASFALLFVAGITQYPFYVFPWLFSWSILADLAWKYRRNHTAPSRRVLVFAFALLASTSVLLALTPFIQATSFSSATHTAGAGLSPLGWLTGSQVLIAMLAPLLFLPVLSPRWTVCMLPFLFLVFTTSGFPYVFPVIFQLQYPSMVIPFLWLGTIDGLVFLKNHLHVPARWAKTRVANRPELLKIQATRAVGIGIVIVIVVSALFYQPYGPFNQRTTDAFNISQELDVNESRYTSLLDIARMVPSGVSQILIQNNLPQAMINHFGPYVTTPGFILSPTNTDIRANTFPYIYNNVSLEINYAIGDTDSYMFTLGSVEEPSMYTLVRELHGSGLYGIVAEGNGIFLLERNYTGSPSYYVPYNQQFAPSAFDVFPWIHRQQGTIVMENVTNHTTAWFGPYVGLPPGDYSVSLRLWTNSNLATNSFVVRVSGDYYTRVFDLQNVSGSAFAHPDTWTNITFDIDLDNFAAAFEVAGQNMDWQGNLVLGGIAVTQISP